MPVHFDQQPDPQILLLNGVYFTTLKGMPPPFTQLGGAGLNVSPWQLGPPPSNPSLAASLQQPNAQSFFNVFPPPMNRPPFSSNSGADEGK